MATQKEWGEGGEGRGDGGREGGEFLYIRCTGVMSFCRSAYFIIFFNSSGAKAENSSKWSETL